jgi:hypothetical protein
MQSCNETTTRTSSPLRLYLLAHHFACTLRPDRSSLLVPTRLATFRCLARAVAFLPRQAAELARLLDTLRRRHSHGTGPALFGTSLAPDLPKADASSCPVASPSPDTGGQPPQSLFGLAGSQPLKRPAVGPGSGQRTGGTSPRAGRVSVFRQSPRHFTPPYSSCEGSGRRKGPRRTDCQSVRSSSRTDYQSVLPTRAWGETCSCRSRDQSGTMRPAFLASSRTF